MTTIESRVAEAILQRGTQIEIDGVTYDVAPPTCETLILYSEEISKAEIAGGNLVKNGRSVGEALAILILGSENLYEKRKVWQKGRLKLPVRRTIIVDKKAELSRLLLQRHSPAQLTELAGILLHKLEVKNFTALTISLAGINILKPTKMVSKKKRTRASGR